MASHRRIADSNPTSVKFLNIWETRTKKTPPLLILMSLICYGPCAIHGNSNLKTINTNASAIFNFFLLNNKHLL